MGKRLMTLSDLHNYFSAQGKTQKFSCGEDGDQIVVQVDGKLNFAKDNNTDGLYPVNLQLCFVGDNLNNSRITKESMTNALASAKYRPILGYIWEDEDGNAQFAGHNMHIDDNKELIYDEIPIGVISEEATLSYDKDNKKIMRLAKAIYSKNIPKQRKFLKENRDVMLVLNLVFVN